MKIFSFFIISLMLYQNSLAGNKTGNGGFVVECISISKFEVLDVFDELKTMNMNEIYLSPSNSLDENMKILITKIDETDPVLANTLTTYYLYFKSKIILMENLNDFQVSDLKEDVIPSQSICWHKLAVVQRIETDGIRYYFVDKGLWRGLTNINKAYLALHEIYYTYLLNKKELDTSNEVRKFVFETVWKNN